MTFQNSTIKNNNGQEDYNRNRDSSSEPQGDTREQRVQEQQQEAGVALTAPFTLMDVWTHQWAHQNQGKHSSEPTLYQQRPSHERVLELIEEAILIAESPLDDFEDDIDFPVVVSTSSATKLGGRRPRQGNNDSNFQLQ